MNAEFTPLRLRAPWRHRLLTEWGALVLRGGMGPRPGLPADLSSFVGRRRELAQGRQLLSRTRLLTVTGLGGVGKTRLAVELARRVSGSFPSGVCLVELANLHDPGSVPAAVAAALGLEDDGRGLMPRLTERLRGCRMLLLLDNCEHVLAAAGQVAGWLLGSCPDLRLLATSRAPLGVEGETVLALTPMAQPERAGLPDPGQLLSFDAVRLFAERAAAAVPGFAVDAGNAAAVTALCQRLDGIPLALELAAGRLRALDVGQLVDQLQRRVEVLRAPGPDRGRQQTLRTALDWSYDLLGPAEQALWRRLSVFAGGFSLSSAEAVCAGGPVAARDVVNLLATLVDQSLVERIGSRYRLLQVVREYAGDRLSLDDDADRVIEQHRHHFAGVAARAEAHWWGPDQFRILQELSTDHDNFVAAIERCEADPRARRSGLVLAGRLWPLWMARGHLGEGRRYLARLLDAAPEPARERAYALRVAAAMAVDQGDMGRATQWLAEGTALAGQFGDWGALAELTAVLARVSPAGRDPHRAAALIAEAETLAREKGNSLTQVFVLSLHAELAAASGQYTEAAGLLDQALCLCRQAGERWMRREILQGLGMCLTQLGRLDEAAARFRESVENAGDLEDWRGVAIAAEGMAGVELARGRLEEAALLLGAAASVWEATLSELPAAWRGWHDHCEGEARDRLGKREFGRAWEEGAELTVEETAALLLGVTKPAAAPVPRGRHPALTRRETEVAALVAQGLRNREIAAALVVSERTVESHVNHILAKLGLSSRTHIAAWAADLGLQSPAG